MAEDLYFLTEEDRQLLKENLSRLRQQRYGVENRGALGNSSTGVPVDQSAPDFYMVRAPKSGFVGRAPSSAAVAAYCEVQRVLDLGDGVSFRLEPDVGTSIRVVVPKQFPAPVADSYFLAAKDKNGEWFPITAPGAGDGIYQVIVLASGGNTVALLPNASTVLVYAPAECSTLTNLTGGRPGRSVKVVNVAGGTVFPFALGSGFQTNVASGAYQTLGPGEGAAFVGASPPSRPWTSVETAAHAALTRTNLPVTAPATGALTVRRKQNVYCLDGGDFPLVDRTQSDCATNPNVGDLLYVYNDRGGTGQVTIVHDTTFTDASGGVARFFLPRGEDMELQELEGAIFIYGPVYPGDGSSSSGSGSSGGGGAYCFAGNCGDPGVPASLTAVVSDAVGCWTLAPDTVTLDCQNAADPPDGFHFYQTSTSISACGSLESWSINGDPAVYLSAGASFAHAQPGYTCSPFHALFLMDDGEGNSATITVDE